MYIYSAVNMLYLLMHSPVLADGIVLVKEVEVETLNVLNDNLGVTTVRPVVHQHLPQVREVSIE